MTDLPRLAVYDLDRTITVHGTWTPFLLYCVVRRQQWRLIFLPVISLLMLAYVAKLIDRRVLKSRMLGLLLGRPHRDVVTRLAIGFASHLRSQGGLRPGALAQIAADKSDGRQLVLATASFDFYAGVIAAQLGFNQVVATKSVWKGDRLQAAVDGANCYGPNKLAMLTAALGPGPFDSVFYSDHHSDAPCFRWASRAVAVNPTAKLAACAADLNARIEDWGQLAHTPAV
jgi:phosphoserine phosphatase